MARPRETGGSTRDNLEVAAARGNANARAQLREPEIPESVAYLREWLYQLHGTSGEGVAGAAPLSWREIEAWATTCGIDPPPTEDELSALKMLDTFLRTESRPPTPASHQSSPPMARAR